MAPYNAVRVPAKRTVPLYFGKVVGFSQMTPAVHSVAAIGAIFIPYGVPTNAVPTTFPSNITVLNDAPGNWGPVDVCGVLNGMNETENAINGGGCFASLGTVTSTKTGFSGVSQGFQDLFSSGRIVVMPVVTPFGNGNSGSVTIVDFIVVQLLEGGSGGGQNWKCDVQVLGSGFDSLRKYGLGPIRNLVE